MSLDDVEENKEVSKKYEEIWEGVKKEIAATLSIQQLQYTVS